MPPAHGTQTHSHMQVRDLASRAFLLEPNVNTQTQGYLQDTHL